MRPPATLLEDHVEVGRAMATRVTIRTPVAGSEGAIREACAKAIEVFRDVDQACTRFDPESPLMRANRSPKQFHCVPDYLFRSIVEAKRAYDETHGRFDPRVLGQLVALGYVKTLAFGTPGLAVDVMTPPRRGHPEPWRPRFRASTREVALGAMPVDLGGIGKGLAVRWSAQVLAQSTPDFLVDAGGDCFCSGHMGDGSPWAIGVEDPFDRNGPVATLVLSNRAATTSSIRLRQWIANGRRVHHLIDPSTGEPGGRGLMSVTVVGKDPARAEVWSKALFVAGRARIENLAQKKSVAALWVDEDGVFSMSSAMAPYVQWQRA